MSLLVGPLHFEPQRNKVQKQCTPCRTRPLKHQYSHVAEPVAVQSHRGRAAGRPDAEGENERTTVMRVCARSSSGLQDTKWVCYNLFEHRAPEAACCHLYRTRHGSFLQMLVMCFSALCATRSPKHSRLRQPSPEVKAKYR